MIGMERLDFSCTISPVYVASSCASRGRLWDSLMSSHRPLSFGRICCSIHTKHQPRLCTCLLGKSSWLSSLEPLSCWCFLQCVCLSSHTLDCALETNQCEGAREYSCHILLEGDTVDWWQDPLPVPVRINPLSNPQSLLVYLPLRH